MISVEGQSKDVTAEIDLQEILPDNMRVAENTSDTVIVTITVLLDDIKDISLDVDDITVNNLASNLAVSYGQTDMTVRVKGAGSLIGSLTGKDLGASIDLKDLEAGEETGPVSFELPAGDTLEEEATITVSLKEKSKTETETAAETANGSGGN